MSIENDMKLEQGRTGIVTADEFFRGHDGNNYKYVAGPIYYFEAEEMMGFVPKKSANWFVVVGDPYNESHGIQQIIAGCQVHYANVVSQPHQIAEEGQQNLLDLRL